MALRFVDSFDHYSTSQIGRKWNTVIGSVSILSTSGRRGGGCLDTVSSTRSVIHTFGANLATVYVGFAFNRNGGSSAGWILGLNDGASDQCGMYLQADGRISFSLGATAPATSTATVPSTGWCYLEMRATIDDAPNGVYEIRLNGANILSSATADTKSTANLYVTSMSLNGRISTGTAGIGTNTLFDDLYVSDSAFLGDVRIDSYVPDAAGSSTQFTANVGLNYQCVDDATSDDNSTYVESSTNAHKDLYGFPVLGFTPTLIKGVQVVVTAQKSDSGSRTFQSVTKSNVTEELSAAFSPTTSYQMYKDIVENDPNTAAAWLQAGLEAAEFGILNGSP